MPDAAPPPTIVFDVNETLLDLRPLDALFERRFGDARVRRAWFDRVLRMAMTATLTGRYHAFGEVGWAAFEALARLHDVAVDEADRAALRTTMRRLPAHADVRPALDRLRGAGLSLAALTNSSEEAADAQLEHAGLISYFDLVLSVDGVQRYKPHPAVYRHAAERLGRAPSDLRLVAAHAWDVTGAVRAGWKAAFVRRPTDILDALAERPDIIESDLGRIADRILAADRTPPTA